MNRASFNLLLFTVDPQIAREATAGGAAGIVIDWENRGKAERQRGSDTEINLDTVDDLRRVHAVTDAPIFCRVNGAGRHSAAEVDMAIAAGAQQILLPMVRSVDDVRLVLDIVGGRCGVGILIETPEAVEAASELAQLPLSCVYVGLNDLAIARRSASIFDAVVDGTVDRIRPLFDMPFGFGGLTLPDRGSPVPCRLLIGEMARLECSFSFLRRSFRRDTAGQRLAQSLGVIDAALGEARRRSHASIVDDREAFCAAVASSLAVVPQS